MGRPILNGGSEILLAAIVIRPFSAMPYFEPIQHERLFNRSTLYSEMTWTDLRAVIKGFRSRIEHWYIRPAQRLRASRPIIHSA